MASTTCGHCGHLTHMTIITADTQEKEIVFRGAPTSVWISDAAYRCDGCKRLSVAETWTKSHPGHNDHHIDEAIDAAGTVRWEPKSVNRVSYADVPPETASAASEAHACASISARRGAIILARAVVEAAAKTQKAQGSDLYKKLDWLREQRLLLPGIVDAAHEVRHFGNDMAHGDFGDEVTAEDVEEILGIMDDVLDALFIQPARTLRRAEARAARKTGS
ncbi:DUF4145 domain-containing protein [Microbacterium sp. A1-JK]|uniref:DUF4145 domain-containing protein n=1 Tax=Microbacterium sp. A1-JK TaxID=3177516 RepID=UPI0038840D1F